MTRDDAHRLMKELLGDRARYTVLRHNTSPERRAQATTRYQAALAKKEELRRRIEETFGAEIRAIEKQIEQTGNEARAYKFKLYRRGDRADIEVAKGDTWEALFAAANVKRSA